MLVIQVPGGGGAEMVQGAKIFQEGTSIPLLPLTFRAYVYRTFTVCQYNYRMC